MTWKNPNAYEQEGVQKVRAGRFETLKLISSNVGDTQNKNTWKLGNSYSGQLTFKGGERKAEKTEKTTEEREEEVRAEKTENTTMEEEEGEEEEEEVDEVNSAHSDQATEEEEEEEEKEDG